MRLSVNFVYGNTKNYQLQNFHKSVTKLDRFFPKSEHIQSKRGTRLVRLGIKVKLIFEME